MESNYKKELIIAHNSLSSDTLDLVNMIDQLKDYVVADYNGVPFNSYKSQWVRRIIDYFKDSEIDMVKNPKPNWENISSCIIDKLVSNEYDFKGKRRESASTTTATDIVSSSSTTDPSIISNSNSTDNAATLKLVKLSRLDKEKIDKMYNDLDRSHVWKLSNGTIVEDKMRQLAQSLDREHPCHSLILDLDDPYWVNIFTENELQEMRDFKTVEMPDMPEVDAYLEELSDINDNHLYRKIEPDDFPLESDQKWMQMTFRDTFRLLKSDFFPIQNQTESNVVKKVWSCLDSCFDFSSIKCVSGEKCSRASADAVNYSRSIADLCRQFSGRKMDYLFTTKKTEYEVGCGECALVGGVNTTKELYDSAFKMPKVLKDMATSIFSSRPGLVRDIALVGFYIGETKIKLLVMNFPSGYVARVDCFNPVQYPKVKSEIYGCLPVVLKLIMTGRLIMESTKGTIERYRGSWIIGKQHPNAFSIPRNFTPAVACSRKRRSSQLSSSSNNIV